MKPNIFYYKDNITQLDFKHLAKRGYNTNEIFWDDFSFLQNLNKNDFLFIDLYYYDALKDKFPTNIKLNIIIFRSHEYIPVETRKNYLNTKCHNHILYFITTHLDKETIGYDFSIYAKCFSFGKVLPIEMFKHPQKRNKKFNFYNRAINLRRLKVFELLKKKNITLSNCYYTFAGKIIQSDFMENPLFANNILYRRYKNVNTLKEFYIQKSKGDYEIDIDYIESFKNEFVKYEDTGYLKTEEMYPLIYESLDSYISFIIESSDDTGNDLRITEKLFRAMLSKNIFLVLQCSRLTKSLNAVGIQTFDEVFNLNNGWDDSKVEINRINDFTSAIEYINNFDIEKIENIYLSDEIQKKLEINYQLAKKSTSEEEIYKEIENKLISTMNGRII